MPDAIAVVHHGLAPDVVGRYWPSVENSPGGLPPTIAIVSPIKLDKNKLKIAVSTEVRVRNLRGTSAEVKIELIGELNPDAVLVGSRFYIADQGSKDPVVVAFSREVWKGRKGKQYIRVRVVSGEYELYCSNLIKAK